MTLNLFTCNEVILPARVPTIVVQETIVDFTTFCKGANCTRSYFLAAMPM
ncbi:MAG TPA: hypothetical protein VIG72_07945 [Pontibacter sp.]